MVGFDQFWSLYPRRKGKLVAMKAFEKALKLASLESLLSGAKAYAEEVRDTEPRYIAHPSTWLNQGRWMDEYETPSQVDLTKWRKPEPHEIGTYRAEHPYLDRDPEWVPKDWTPKLRIVGG